MKRSIPKAGFAGRLCRLRYEGGLEAVLCAVEDDFSAVTSVHKIEGSKWGGFWIRVAAAISAGDKPHDDGVFRYPFLFREADDRYIIASTEAKLVDFLFERAGIKAFIESPRVNVDKATRELVFPPPDKSGKIAGRRYTIGAVYGAVEGYARALRNMSFFGEDLAEAALFRSALEQISVTRVAIRDPVIDRELLSLNGNGGLDFHFSSAAHLNYIDTLTAFLRAHGYIEWRSGKKWEPL